MGIQVNDSLDYLGPEMKQEIADAVEKWLESLRLFQLLVPDRIKLTQVDLHIIIEGKHAAKVVKTIS